MKLKKKVSHTEEEKKVYNILGVALILIGVAGLIAAAIIY